MRPLLSDPLFYSRRKPLVNIFSCCLALVGIFLCCPEYKFEHKFKSYGKSCSEQGFGQDKMSSVLINDCLIVAAVGCSCSLLSIRRIYFPVSQKLSSSAPIRISLPLMFSTFIISSSVCSLAFSESINSFVLRVTSPEPLVSSSIMR